MKQYAKAIVACALAGLGGLEVAALDNQFTARELIHSAILALLALAGTYAVPNEPAAGQTDDQADDVLDVPINR